MRQRGSGYLGRIEGEEQEWYPQVREGLGRKVLQEVRAEMLGARKKALDATLG